MITAGVDVGALSTEVVIMGDGGRLLASSILPTGANSERAAERAMREALTQAGLRLENLDRIVATGYGRVRVPFAHQQVTEITCHARGAVYFFPRTRTVIDVGGQDSKVIRVSPRGKPVDFAMNDKCAAGTGRFLEVMARALEVDLESLGELSAQSRNEITISSMCTVFAESEVVSLIAQGTPKEDIIRGLHNSIADRILTLAHRVGVEREVSMSGGVAKNRGVVRAISEKLGLPLNVPREPQIVGALGAALLALEAED
ncbi:MAG TPA: 2-hydroxyglutaryl-CoA dehydratase [Armatimonadetes bacterium]|nr:2-hydroxyglutaryl-CoA dehydratase [Armatimonadota bacterium]